MSFILCLFGTTLVFFGAYIFFGGWSAVIFVGCVFFIGLLGTIIKATSEARASAGPSTKACEGELVTPVVSADSAWRCEIDIHVHTQAANPHSTTFSPTNTSSDFSSSDCEEGILDVDDIEVPEIVREHGRGFRNPAKYVVPLGNDEYVLFGEDGEVLDAVHLKD